MNSKQCGDSKRQELLVQTATALKLLDAWFFEERSIDTREKNK